MSSIKFKSQKNKHPDLILSFIAKLLSIICDFITFDQKGFNSRTHDNFSRANFDKILQKTGTPTGNRTPVSGMRIQCPGR